jgi:adiponectin receptor
MPETYEHLMILGILNAIGLIFFLGKVPERWFSKPYFDYCGHSHNIFHCVVLAIIGVDFYFSFELYKARQEFKCPPLSKF